MPETVMVHFINIKHIEYYIQIFLKLFLYMTFVNVRAYF